jgi:hypothetical protein
MPLFLRPHRWSWRWSRRKDFGPFLRLRCLGINSGRRCDARHSESNDLSWSPKRWTIRFADLRSGGPGCRIFPVFAGARVLSPCRHVESLEGATGLGALLRIDVFRFACVRREYRLAKVFCKSPLDRSRFRRTRRVVRGSGGVSQPSATRHYRLRGRMVVRERVALRSRGLSSAQASAEAAGAG